MSALTVSRETAERLDIFVEILAHWQNKCNLISNAALASLWSRHIADCAQVLLTCPRIIRWLDIGSGAGFPGMVVAMQLADVPGAEVHCVDSDPRKCAFLREVARATSAPAIVYCARVQSLTLLGKIDGVTARAVASLPKNLSLADGWLKAGAVGVFPCGQSDSKQLEGLQLQSNYQVEIVPSVVDSESALLRVRKYDFKRRRRKVEMLVL